MLKCFYILIWIAVFKLSFCHRRMGLGNESVLGKKYLVYFVKSPYSKASDDTWICAGAIVTPSQILTAAACLVEMDKIYAIAGYKKYVHGKDIDKDECTKRWKKKVVKISVPKDYKISANKQPEWMNVDVGVAIVQTPYNFSDHSYSTHCSYEPQSIYINFEKRNELDKTRAVALGWGGKNTPTELTKDHYLQEATTVIIEKKNCANLVSSNKSKELVYKYLLCASGNSLDEGEEITLERLLDDCPTGTCMKEDFKSRRLNTDAIKTGTQSNRNDKKSRRSSLAETCQNDHGGPLITWVGTRQMMLGVALKRISEPNSDCAGPRIYVSTAETAKIIKCLLERNDTRRKYCNDQLDDKRYQVNDIEIKWPEESKSNSSPLWNEPKLSSNIRVYVRQGDLEQPLHVRPTKELGNLDEQENPQQFEKPGIQPYNPQMGLQRSNPYYQPQSRLPPDQRQGTLNGQYRDQPPQRPPHDMQQPLMESQNQPQVDAYNQPQMASYNQPQMDSYNQPQMESQNQPQVESYVQPQIESYNPPQMESYNQPQMESQNQPQIELQSQPQGDGYGQQQIASYNHPQVESYNQPQMESLNQPPMESINQPPVESYNQPQVDSYNQPQVDSYNQPQMDSYNQPQIESQNQPPMESPHNQPQEQFMYNKVQVPAYKPPQVETYKPQQVETYKPPQEESYNQPQIESYKPPQAESYNQPEVESFKRPQAESLNQPQTDQFKSPQRDPYKQPPVQSYNQPEAETYKSPGIGPLKPPLLKIEPFSQAQNSYKETQSSYNRPQIESFTSPPAVAYNPLEIISENQPDEGNSFKRPMDKHYKPPPVEPYKQQNVDPNMQQSFKPAPVEPYEQPHLRQVDQQHLQQHVQPFDQQHAQPYDRQHAQPFDQQQSQPFDQQQPQTFDQQHSQPFDQQHSQSFDQQHAQPFDQQHAQPFGQQEQVPGPPYDLSQMHALRKRPQGPEGPLQAEPERSRGESQTFEQMYSQLQAAGVESPGETPSSVTEQTFEELYKNLHDGSLDMPHDIEFDPPRLEQQFDQQFDQTYERVPKILNEPPPIEKLNEEVKVRPQMPLDYPEYTSNNRRRGNT